MYRSNHLAVQGEHLNDKKHGESPDGKVNSQKVLVLVHSAMSTPVLYRFWLCQGTLSIDLPRVDYAQSFQGVPIPLSQKQYS